MESPDGTVEVSLSDGVLAVRDHGPGFEEEDLAFVFDRFYRAENARRLPGSGLGLAIVRQAAEASGGYAEAENAPAAGRCCGSASGRPSQSDSGLLQRTSVKRAKSESAEQSSSPCSSANAAS